MYKAINKKFRFREFQVYKDARKFNKELKKFSKEKFPKEEQFCLLSQLWRASDSIILNIAEGTDRGTDKDFAHFLNNSHTSLNEVVSCLDVSLDNNYISEKEHLIYLGKAELLANQLTAFRKKLLIDSNSISVKCPRRKVSFQRGRQMSKVKCQTGFSLLELLIYVAILSIATMTIAGVYISINQGRGRSEAVNEVNSNLRFAIEKMNQDIRSANFVNVPDSAGATSTILTLNVSGTEISYCSSGNYLRRQAGGACSDSSELVTSDKVLISELIFTRVENINEVLQKTIISVKTDLAVSYNSASPDWQYTASKSTTFSLRH